MFTYKDLKVYFYEVRIGMYDDLRTYIFFTPKKVTHEELRIAEETWTVAAEKHITPDMEAWEKSYTRELVKDSSKLEWWKARAIKLEFETYE